MRYLYLFPYREIPPGSRIAVYGAGTVGCDYLLQIRESEYCEVSFVASQDYQTNVLAASYGYELVSPESFLRRKDFEKVVVASVNQQFREEMLHFLGEAGIDAENIVSIVRPLPVDNFSYSQYGEDRIILLAFEHMGYFREGGKLPTYIDVGAHHPYVISNTALFYQMGCRGVNVEANPDLIAAFERDRPEDVNLCCGVGPEEGDLPFYVTDVLGQSTMRKERVSLDEDGSPPNGDIHDGLPVCNTLIIPVRKLEHIIRDYCGNRWPDFMSIDIEGMEYDVLSGCDLSDGPALIAVEVNYDGDLFVDMFREKGYFPYLWYVDNILFVKNEYESLVHAHTERGEK